MNSAVAGEKERERIGEGEGGGGATVPILFPVSIYALKRTNFKML